MKLPEYQNHEEKKQFFSYVKIDTKDVIDSHFGSLLANSPRCIFRGVHEAKYKLFTSVQREWIAGGLGRHTTINNLVDTLIRNIRANRILNTYYQSLNIAQTDLLYLSLLQHYSAPTPLLDFSHSLNIAFYFATKNLTVSCSENNIDDYFSVYYIDLDKCGNELVRMDDFLCNGLQRGQQMYEEFTKNNPYVSVNKSLLDDIDEFTQWMNPKNPSGSISTIPLAFIDNPIHSHKITTPYTQNTLYWSNLNITAQEGCFLLYNNDDIPVEAYIKAQKYLPPIWCVDIHKSLAEYVKTTFLQNLPENILFPNVSQMAKDAYTSFCANL
ncbi:FRG domain-containing protein [uncultured Bacteroides sp.]|uniref:FRG domain-containing protein n=1 Tax=uncultured Bacteroides sp. TaxID=162156 RepID=UPI00259493F9|nr:FRG domain-containing protein [uncultured Bacteroides sp.]